MYFQKKRNKNNACLLIDIYKGDEYDRNLYSDI